MTSGRTPFDVSQRELCDLAGISGRDTVAKAIHRLVDLGLVKEVTPELARYDRLRRSPSWELLEPEGLAEPSIAPESMLRG